MSKQANKINDSDVNALWMIWGEVSARAGVDLWRTVDLWVLVTKATDKLEAQESIKPT